ncbi:MAG: hypothetical protein ABI475_06165 [Methylophilaceae bacterium]
MHIVREIWGEIRQWRNHFETFGANGKLIDQLEIAFRDLDDICSTSPRSEIRRTLTPNS